MDLIVFSLTINWHTHLNCKELTYLSRNHFFWPLVILVIPTSTITLHDLLTWLFLLIQLTKLSGLNTFLWFLQKYNFLERQISVILSRDPSRNFFSSPWASLPMNLVELLALNWLFYIVRLKPIKSIQKLLWFLSSYINLQFSNLYSARTLI